MKSVERFSNRVENYVRYRPGYPPAIVDLLKTECGLDSDSVIADIGSGTGKLAEIFLNNGNVVIGVEPGDEMRVAAESILTGYTKFQSVAGTAEATTLTGSSVDIIVAGQAFHWFDPARSKVECRRILKPNGWVALIWNERQTDSTPFLQAYEKLLLTLGTDYSVIRHENAYEAIENFFAPQKPRTNWFPNCQKFDFESLKGRLLSSSYTPEPSDPQFGPMISTLEAIFREYQQEGLVQFEYDTRVFYGQLT